MKQLTHGEVKFQFQIRTRTKLLKMKRLPIMEREVK